MNDLTDEGYMTGIAPADLLAALARAAEDVGAAAKAVIALGDDIPNIPEGAEGEWTPAEILGHVCDGARVWGGRMRRVVREENPELESFDEGMALRVAGYHWKRLEPLLAEFRIVSDDTLAFLRGLTPGDWTRMGRHPTLGRVSLGDLARIEMEHERDHARQLREAIAEATMEATAQERLE
ncbi:MAG TPA: DinB family protein [Ktedonobacterales bacterium]|nr:DinB family protein [Ktedonobacterales bacterium]